MIRLNDYLRKSATLSKCPAVKVALIVGILFLFLAGLCTFAVLRLLKMEYLPSAESIKGHVGEFVLFDKELEGLYGNMDAPCIVFKFSLPDDAGLERDDVVKRIQQSVSTKGWTFVDDVKDRLRFKRFGPSVPGRVTRVEEVRVGLAMERGDVYVAWILDYYRDVDEIETKTGPGGAWANENLWPRFESLMQPVNSAHRD